MYQRSLRGAINVARLIWTPGIVSTHLVLWHPLIPSSGRGQVWGELVWFHFSVT